MQLKISTDYGIRIVLYLATIKRSASSKELSDAMKIPQSFVFKVIKKLQVAGIIESQTGVQGGFTLIRPPQDITLFELINMMESTTRINRCLETDKYCSLFATENCPVRNFYCDLQSRLDGYLQGITVKDLLK